MEPSAPVTTALPDAVRVWRGFRNPAITQTQFFDKLGGVFIPIAMQMQRIYGLIAYLPAVTPADHVPGLPDEVALVFYPTQAAYRATKEYAGGRAYSDLHAIVFDLPQSRSRFPEPGGDGIDLDIPYHLLGNRADWQTAPVELWMGARRPDVPTDQYQSVLTNFARTFRSAPEGASGAILCAEKDWLLYWQCGRGLSPQQLAVLESVGNRQMHRLAEPLTLPSELTEKCPPVPVHGGEFFNLQFPRLQI